MRTLRHSRTANTAMTCRAGSLVEADPEPVPTQYLVCLSQGNIPAFLSTKHRRPALGTWARVTDPLRMPGGPHPDTVSQGSVPHPGREALDHPALRRCQGPRRAATLRLSRWWCCLSCGGDRAAEASAESTVTEGSPDSGWRSRKDVSQGPTAGQGWPGNRAPGHQLRCSGRLV